jgi:acetyl-CoA acetyltransferase
MARTQRPVALVGVGYTALSRRPDRDEIGLVLEACRGAALDAGLEPEDLDGINLQVHHEPPPATEAVIAGLAMREVAWCEEGGIGAASLAKAALAVDAGLASSIVVCKIMNTTAPIGTPQIEASTGGVEGPGQFEVPYGLGYTMQRVGLTTRRWMHRYGITAEQVGWLCVVQREHALLNPYAIFKEPLTLDDYLSSRWIAEPLRLFDCDYPVNGAFAYVVTTLERARDLRHPPVVLSAWGEAGVELLAHHRLPEELGGMPPWVEELYRDAGCGPGDMDLWMLYDGYSYFAMQWMETLGLVGRGESGSYVEGGARIRFDGEHPVNTHGGQLSEGRLHGAGHVLEAVQQLRGTAGARQVDGAAHAIISSTFPNTGAAAVLSLA